MKQRGLYTGSTAVASSGEHCNCCVEIQFLFCCHYQITWYVTSQPQVWEGSELLILCGCKYKH